LLLREERELPEDGEEEGEERRDRLWPVLARRLRLPSLSLLLLLRRLLLCRRLRPPARREPPRRELLLLRLLLLLVLRPLRLRAAERDEADDEEAEAEEAEDGEREPEAEEAREPESAAEEVGRPRAAPPACACLGLRGGLGAQTHGIGLDSRCCTLASRKELGPREDAPPPPQPPPPPP
jgi:hypothetical protein